MTCDGQIKRFVFCIVVIIVTFLFVRPFLDFDLPTPPALPASKPQVERLLECEIPFKVERAYTFEEGLMAWHGYVYVEIKRQYAGRFLVMAFGRRVAMEAYDATKHGAAQWPPEIAGWPESIRVPMERYGTEYESQSQRGTEAYIVDLDGDMCDILVHKSVG